MGSSAAYELPGDIASRVAQWDRYGYLFGERLTQSMCPFLHNQIYKHLDMNWGQITLESADLDLFLRLTKDPKFCGASVTMPNKVAILPHLDAMTDELRDVGACNTVFLKDGSDGRRLLCGTNTDVVGIREALVRNVADLQGFVHRRPALVIGGGEAARSAVYALRKWLDVTDIYLVNRDAAEVAAVVQECTARNFGTGLVHVRSIAQAQQLPGPGAIVACIPDVEPSTPEELEAWAVAKVFLGAAIKGAMLEMCYNPTPYTRLGTYADAQGWQVILGTEALFWQIFEQNSYWTGREVGDMPVSQARAAFAEKMAERPRDA